MCVSVCVCVCVCLRSYPGNSLRSHHSASDRKRHDRHKLCVQISKILLKVQVLGSCLLTLKRSKGMAGPGCPGGPGGPGGPGTP